MRGWGGASPPRRPGGSIDKIRELTGEDLTVDVAGALPEKGTPFLLRRDPARKHERRGFTPRLSTVSDVPVQENDQEDEDDEDDDDQEGAGPNEMYSKHTLDLPAHGAAQPPSRPLPTTPPPLHHTFFDNLDASPATTAAADAETTAADADPVRTGTISKWAASLRRHLSMRTVREKLGSTEALRRTLRLPRRHVKELLPLEKEEKERKKDGGEGSLARRLLGRQKKPKRPPIPEGWLFGPPPE